MPEEEPDMSAITYRAFAEMVPRNSLPISIQEANELWANAINWYDNVSKLEDDLIGKYGKSVVEQTKLHHLLSGSSQSYDEWISYPDDTPDGEMMAFIKNNLDKAT